MSHKKIEVSAILEQDDFHNALAITPEGICYQYHRHVKSWDKIRSGCSGLQYWSIRAYECNRSGRRIRRGIFTIKVADNG